MVIPLFKVFMAEDVKAVGKVILNDNVVAVNSGTAAITIALRLAGVGHNDHVATTPMTCLATNEPILSLGAHPVWVDVEPDGSMCPESLRETVKLFHKHIKAIICMDWGGLPCKLDELKKAAGGIPIIEDACQAIGSSYNFLPVGNKADYVAFSFQAIKHITTVDGGALVVNTNQVKEAQLMRWFGLDRSESGDMRCSQDPLTWGYKSHMNDVSAAVGLANIRHLPWILMKTKANADTYNVGIRNKNIKIITPMPHRKSNYWLYTIFVEDVKGFIKYMNKNNIACSQVHDRNDTKQMFREDSHPLPGVDHFDKHHVCIPVGWWLTKENLQHIVQTVNKYDSRSSNS